MMQIIFSVFVQYLEGIFVLDTWISGFYKRNVGLKKYILYTTMVIAIGIVYTIFMPVRGLKMVFGCLIQCAYAMLIFESKSLKKIVLVLTFTFMACLSEILTYFMFKIIYGADFSSVDLANRYDLLPVTILNTINYLFVQIVLALKNRYKTEIKNIGLIFLSAFNIFMLALMLLTTAQGEMGRIPSTFAAYMILFFSLIMVVSIGGYLVLGQVKKNRESEFIASQLSMQQEQMEKMKLQYNDLRRIRHDYNNHIATLQALFNMQKYNEAGEYIENFSNELKSLEGISFCNNAAVDAVLYTKRTYGIENGVNVVYEINTKIPETIDQIDICTVLFNLLDNAIDYSIKNNKEEVLLRIYRNKGFFVMVTENECSEFSTTTDKFDKDNHGVGLKITKDISKKYNGNEYIGIRDNKFIHIVSLDIERE